MRELLRRHRDILGEIEVKSFVDVGIADDIEENGLTFEENALTKARVGAEAGYISIADDSGLAVDALDGAPGVFSARYSGGHGNDEDNNDLLLANMESVPDEKRTARYIAAIACAFPDGRSFTVRGSVEGVILRERRGSGGFGYDPLFFCTEAGETFADLSLEEKNKISHRARALHAFCLKMVEYL